MTTHDPRLSVRQPEHPSAPRTSELLKLLTFLSPAFPIGAFSFSHGLEWQIDSGAIRSAEALRAWLTDVLEIGSGWNDSVLLAEAHRATAVADWPRLRAAVELSVAMSPSRERRLESTAQGRAFLDAVAIAWPSIAAEHLPESDSVAYSVAVGAIAADHGIALEDVLPAYLNAFAANLISVGVRLIPIGQAAGLRILESLHPLIAATARRAETSTLGDLGSATVLSDIASMRHEEQHSRIFRT